VDRARSRQTEALVPKLTSTRRGFLTLASASATNLLQGHEAQAAAESSAAGMEDACILTPQSEEGPYYLDPKLVRADVTEGRPGVPLALRLRVIEAGSCTWHCDARGIYSAFPGQGDSHNIDMTSKTFLRGTQMADGGGWSTFKSIYPGWYAGRATHIHFKVFLDERTVLTGQTFFPEALNEYIYTNVPDYAKRPQQRLVINANDRVAMESDPEHKAYCAVKEERERYVAMLTLAVDRNAKVSANGPGGLPPPPPGPPPPGLREGGRPPKAQWIKDRLAAVVPGLKRSPF
jgi:protocatechuate 3,4-dioxygenase beta subunit